jgi:hypothetical protein
MPGGPWSWCPLKLHRCALKGGLGAVRRSRTATQSETVPRDGEASSATAVRAARKPAKSLPVGSRSV